MRLGLCLGLRGLDLFVVAPFGLPLGLSLSERLRRLPSQSRIRLMAFVSLVLLGGLPSGLEPFLKAARPSFFFLFSPRFCFWRASRAARALAVSAFRSFFAILAAAFAAAFSAFPPSVLPFASGFPAQLGPPAIQAR